MEAQFVETVSFRKFVAFIERLMLAHADTLCEACNIDTAEYEIFRNCYYRQCIESTLKQLVDIKDLGTLAAGVI